MNEEWWERPTCFLCDFWWLFLLVLAVLLSAYFLRGYWLYQPTLQPTLSFSPTPTRVLTLGTGDVQVTLIWNSTNDLDLWVTDPKGEKIFFGYPSSFSGGELDVDANADCREDVTSQPVENIFWRVGSAPLGEYTVEVNYFKQCEPVAETSFFVLLRVDGKTQEFQSTLHSPGETVKIITFQRR